MCLWRSRASHSNDDNRFPDVHVSPEGTVMLLEGKVAIVYGGAGAISSAVARVFAAQGASVHLVGRTREPLERVAAGTTEAGGRVEVAQLDATDRAAVEEHADAVAQHADGIDVAFNAVNKDDLQGTPLIDMARDDVLRPVTKAVTPTLGGSRTAWSALAGLCRHLASELGPHGIRIAWLLSPGSPDPSTPSEDDPQATETLLHRRPRLEDVAHAAAAVFLASDRAPTMTARRRRRHWRSRSAIRHTSASSFLRHWSVVGRDWDLLVSQFTSNGGP
jgi:3-oxoacyl-[acyl-carrier protein] reductase